jgi:ADP-heptose:LPS heptosyltransferase
MQNAKMGDMICVTPIFRALKKNLPNAKVIVLGSKINRELVQGNSDVDEYVVFERDPKYLVNTFKELNLDVALLTTQDPLALSTSFIAGVPLIVTPQVVNTKAETETFAYKILSKLASNVTYVAEQYFPREFLKVLEPIGIITDDTKKHLAYNSSAKEKVMKFFEENNIKIGHDFVIGVSPSAGNKVKSWFPDRYAKLIQYLIEKYEAKIIIVGAPPDKAIIEEMNKNLPESPNIIDTSSMFTIEELKALVANLNLFISGDTGPIHIADAFDIPTVNILGPVGEDEMPPRGEFHRNVIPPRKRAELFIMTVRSFDPIEAKRQLEVTTVEMVKEVVDKLISDIRSK